MAEFIEMKNGVLLNTAAIKDVYAHAGHIWVELLDDSCEYYDFGEDTETNWERIKGVLLREDNG